MALVVRRFGDWNSTVGGGPAPATTTTAPPAGPSAWGPGFKPPPGYVAPPLPMHDGGPGLPTTATWSLKPGQKPPPAGEGWKGDPVPLPPSFPPPSNVSPFASPAIGYGAAYPEFQPTGYGPGSSPPASGPANLFGLPPLVVIGAGGLLIFLIARRF